MILLPIIFLVLFQIHSIYGVTSKKVTVIHSYEIDHANPIAHSTGFKKGAFRENYYDGINLIIDEHYMDTKTTNAGTVKTKAIGDVMVQKVRDFQPDLLVVFDDNAFKYVGRELFTEFPVLFGGVNARLETYNSSDYHFLKGTDSIYPRSNVSGIFEPVLTEKAIAFFASILPSSVKSGSIAMIIYDSTPTGNALLTEGVIAKSKEKADSLKDLTIIDEQISTFSELKNLVDMANQNNSIKMILPYTFSLLDGESSVGSETIVNYLIENSKTPEITIIDGHAKQGLLMGVGVNQQEVGSEIGVLAGKILNKELKIEDLPILYEESCPTTTFINLDRVNTLGITVDPTIIAGIDNVYMTILDYTWVIFVSFGLIIVGMFIAFGIISIVFAVLSYVVYIKRKRRDAYLNDIVELVSALQLNVEEIEELENKKKKDKIETLLLKIIATLRLFIPFIPQYLLHNDVDEEENTSISDSGSDYSHGSSLNSSNGSTLRSQLSKASSQSKKNSVLSKLKNKNSLTSKRISVGIFKLEGIEDLIFQNFHRSSPSTLVVICEYCTQLINKYIEVVNSSITENNGIINYVNGSLIQASWNSSTTVVHHLRNAFSAGCKAISLWKSFISQESNKPSLGNPTGLNLSKINILSMSNQVDSFVGTVGDSKSKFFTTVVQKDLLSYFSKIQNQFGELEGYSECLCFAENIDEIKFHFFYKYLGEIEYSKGEKKTVILVYPQSNNEMHADEWMYCLKSRDDSDPFLTFNEAYQSFKNDNYTLAESKIKQYLKNCPTSPAGKRLLRKIQTKNEFKVSIV